MEVPGPGGLGDRNPSPCRGPPWQQTCLAVVPALPHLAKLEPMHTVEAVSLSAEVPKPVISHLWGVFLASKASVAPVGQPQPLLISERCQGFPTMCCLWQGHSLRVPQHPRTALGQRLGSPALLGWKWPPPAFPSLPHPSQPLRAVPAARQPQGCSRSCNVEV